MLAVIGAVGQAKREAMLGASEGAHRQGKGAGRYKGRVPTVRRQAAEKLRLKQSLSVDITALRDQIYPESPGTRTNCLPKREIGILLTE